jgi:hypothetical protein
MTSQTPFSKVSSGQRRVLLALLSDGAGNTYRGAAEHLGVCVGTVYEQLRRIRTKHPETYDLFMHLRRQQLQERARRSAAKARAHSREWHRKQANRRYYYRFGCWPWERRRGW